MQRLSDEFRKSLDLTVTTYQRAMTGEVRAYLEARGIGREIAAAYRLGTVDASAAEFAQYQGMISIPYITTLGGVVALKFRQAHNCTQQCSHPKYLTPHPTRMFNTGALDRGEQIDLIAITEGEIDAVILDGVVGIPAVGIPGVKTWEQHRKVWPRIFAGFGQVLVFADRDEPGLQLAKSILQDVDTARMVGLPGKDVNETCLAHGAAEIRRLANV